MNSELFLMGDARYLSGGFRRVVTQSYHEKPAKNNMSAPRVDEESVLDWLRRHDGKQLRDAINDLAGFRAVSAGRSSYHSSQTDRRQSFLMKDDPLPSVGVELEFILDDPGKRAYSALESNWFSLERDGSLPADSGHELVTVPLPAAKYLNPRLWNAVHNLLAPHAASASSSATGFHVHVGLDVFDDAFAGALGFLPAVDRRSLGSLVAMTCYYALVPGDFLFDVYGRENGPFRGRSFPAGLDPIIAALRQNGMTAGRLVDAVAWVFAVGNGASLEMAAKHLDGTPAGVAATISASARTGGYDNSVMGHQVEVNLAPEHTIEFRRGKGTLNPEAMLRMVDFSTLCVRYAARLAAYPDETPSTKTMMEFIAGHATSRTLRDLAAKLAGEADAAEADHDNNENENENEATQEAR